MYRNIQQSYRDNEILTANPLQLVSLLYRGAIDAVASARTSLRQGDILTRSRQITKATSILNELSRSLDHERAEDLSRSLTELYDYLIGRLNEANFLQIEEPLNEALRLLETLSSAWRDTTGVLDRPAFVGEPVAEYQALSCSF